MARKKEFQLKGFISLEEINLSRQKQNYRFYLFDKSWYFPVKHVVYPINVDVQLFSEARWLGFGRSPMSYSVDASSQCSDESVQARLIIG